MPRRGPIPDGANGSHSEEHATVPGQGPAIVFDLGGVLIDWDPRHLYRRYFEDEAAMETFLSTIVTPEWNRGLDGGRGWEEAVSSLTREHPEHADLIAAYRDRWDEMLGGPIHGTVKILSELRSAGYEIHALTNWSAETFPKALERYPFLGWFQDIIVSGEERLAKPDPRLYRVLLDRIGRSAEHCIFIDDGSANVDAAAALGFDAILFRSPEQLGRALAERDIAVG
jgi:2-haloacid dehalogenase